MGVVRLFYCRVAFYRRRPTLGDKILRRKDFTQRFCHSRWVNHLKNTALFCTILPTAETTVAQQIFSVFIK